MPTISQLVDHIRMPLFRNGYALVLSSIITSGLGLLYWMLAARNYSAEIVGLNSAAIAAMMFLAHLSQLNLQNALNRFIPRAGQSTGRLILSAYAMSTVMALVTALIFILGIDIWSPSLSFLKSSPYFVLWFTLATMVWCIFALQDSALTGLRQATWVPIENLIFAVAKIVLLVAFAAAWTQFGILASWTLPLLFLLAPVNMLIFGRLVPQHIRKTQTGAEPIVASQVASYVASDYLASIIWMGTTTLLPLLVLEQAGATANAYFYLSWTIAYALYLVSRNMGMSLIAEAAADQSKLNAYGFRVLAQTGRLLVPGVIILAIGAPYILQIFGPSYAAEGATLLRLLCLSAIPNIITSIYISTLRVQRHMKTLVVVLLLLCGLVLSLSYILLNIYGITGIGWAWLISQTIVAVFLAITQFRTVWLPYLNLQPLMRLLSVPRRWWWQWTLRAHLAKVEQLTPTIMRTITSPDGTQSPTHWQPQKLLKTVSDMTVITVGPENQPPQALLKLPQTSRALASLRQQHDVLATLQADPRLGEWRALLPSVLAYDQVAGQTYVVEQMMPGQLATSLLDKTHYIPLVQTAAATVVGVLHNQTAESVVIGDDLLKRWVDEPLRLVSRVARQRDGKQKLEQVRATLHAALAGRTAAVGWIHGDLAPGNILIDASSRRVTGLIDWELAVPHDLPQLDLVHLFLSTRMVTQKQELGDVVRAFLQGQTLTSHESHLLRTAQATLPGEEIEIRTLVIMAWLRHVADVLSKSTRYDRHWVWLAKNVEGVLQCL